ncbi:integrating conjugative element protein [Mergibacter septicus]|uniref:Integrating conjugative element protein n=1 Tax=Mergibacter septicus TaxID=221402 RepID=A0A8E3S7R2_9PAST|nr:integrating conjugative element protein [Mergibacter septicus]AWX14732.1 integrating conjugative element protein [Mergibacter septicus]QDJ13983.1 integrating conjugative element protein [Mergibacter septicus]UTU48568.1 integrating conjugative element protein [Mergibacter septicus]WMR95803.1 integrating conjugative element protein [Mergibacter septicus]
MKKVKFILMSSLIVAITNYSFASQNYIQATGSAISDNVYYQIGGGNAIMTPPTRQNPYALSVGLGWNANLTCGNFDIKTTVRNQLNNATEGFKDLMGNIIQSATGAVASLPAMVIQRANPQLYDLLTNGVLQGKLDFANAKTSCEALSKKAGDYIDDNGWNIIAKKENLQEKIQSSGGDAVRATKNADKEDGEKGITWIGGQKRGGRGQQPINVILDTAKAGFNILNGRTPTSNASVTTSSCSGLLCETWKNPREASEWLTEVIGDRTINTCNQCGQEKSRAGTGLSPLIEKETKSVSEKLSKVLHERVPSTEDLKSVSSASIPVTRGLIEALKEDPDQIVLSNRLASEIAVSRILEKAILARRTLLAGMREPNVAVNEKAQKELEKSLMLIDREIEQIRLEMDLQRSITNNTATVILNKRFANQSTSYDSNTPTDSDKKFRELSLPITGDN